MSLLLEQEETNQRVEWYYVYLPELGTDPLTVSLLFRPITVGMSMVFAEKIVLVVQVVDLTNPHHPYIIGELVEGELSKLNLGATNGYSFSGKRNREVSIATQCRRYLGLRWGAILSSMHRQVRFPHSYNKEGLNVEIHPPRILFWNA